MNQKTIKGKIIPFGKHGTQHTANDGSVMYLASSQNPVNVLRSVSSAKTHKPHISSQFQGNQSNVNETNSLTSENKVGFQAILQMEIVKMEEAGITRIQIMSTLRAAYPTDYKETRKSWENRKYDAGKKGVFVGMCFKDFVAFLKCCGFKPYRDHSIDRIDNNIGYVLGNVRWLDKSGQASNRGQAGEARRYMHITKCSKATAYRHLLKNPSDVFNTISPDNESDPDNTKLWNDSRQLINRWDSALYDLHPETGQPVAPTATVLGKIGALIKRFGFSHLSYLFPKVIENWIRIHKECKAMYNWNLGSTPAIDNFLSHPKEILAITENIVAEEAEKTQEQAQKTLESEQQSALSQEHKLRADKDYEEQKERAYSVMPEYLSLDMAVYISKNAIDRNQAVVNLLAFCESVGVSEEVFIKYQLPYQRDFPNAKRNQE